MHQLIFHSHLWTQHLLSRKGILVAATLVCVGLFGVYTLVTAHPLRPKHRADGLIATAPSLIAEPLPLPSPAIASPSLEPLPVITQPPATKQPTAKKDILFSVTGKIYRDEDCDGIRDGAEGFLTTPMTVNLFQPVPYNIYATTTSNGVGEFSYIGMIKEGETMTLEPHVVSPYGYKSNPTVPHPSFTFSSKAVLANFEIPQVPAGSIGSCNIP